MQKPELIVWKEVTKVKVKKEYLDPCIVRNFENEVTWRGLTNNLLD